MYSITLAFQEGQLSLLAVFMALVKKEAITRKVCWYTCEYFYSALLVLLLCDSIK